METTDFELQNEEDLDYGHIPQDIENYDDQDPDDDDNYKRNQIRNARRRERAISDAIAERLASKSSVIRQPVIHQPVNRPILRPEVSRVVDRIACEGSIGSLFEASHIVGDSIDDIDDCIRALQRYISMTYVHTSGKRVKGKFIKDRYPRRSSMLTEVRLLISDICKDSRMFSEFGWDAQIGSGLHWLSSESVLSSRERRRRESLWKDRVDELDRNTIYIFEEYDITFDKIFQMNFSCTEMSILHAQYYDEFITIKWEVKPTCTEMAFCRDISFFEAHYSGERREWWFALKDCYHIFDTENEFKEYEEHSQSTGDCGGNEESADRIYSKRELWRNELHTQPFAPIHEQLLYDLDVPVKSFINPARLAQMDFNERAKSQ